MLKKTPFYYNVNFVCKNNKINMQFFDKVKIFITSGKGGNGAITFEKHCKFYSKSPNGGNGGNGGNIILRAIKNLNTLIYFRRKNIFKAENGNDGLCNNKNGKSGKNLIINVPIGTEIYSENGKFKFYDLINENQNINLINGGRGGIGNASCKKMLHNFVNKLRFGIKGESLCLILNLKLFSNIGLLGLSNSGKSLLLKVLTSAKSKVADYPFSTTKPQLGVVFYANFQLVIVGIPAISNKSKNSFFLAMKFLKHLERSEILVYLIDISKINIVTNYFITRKKLEKPYNLSLKSKNEIILLNKIDIFSDNNFIKIKKKFKYQTKEAPILYSSKIISYVIKLKKILFFNFQQKKYKL